MSTEAQTLAVTPQNHDHTVAIQAVQQTQLVASSAVVLDRANLAFFADMIEAADLIPYDKNVSKQVQKFRVMAKIVYGVGHDFDPISAQENIHVIQGRCVLSARGMAIKLRRTGKYDTRVEKLDNEGCRLAALEKNDEGKWILKGHVSWGLPEAEQAKLTTSNTAMYEKWGPDMFYANAIKRVCRRFAPEIMDTKPVLYDTAKRPIEDNTPSPPPQITTSESATEDESTISTASPAIGQEYVSPEYIPAPGAGAEAEVDDLTSDSFSPAKEAQEYTGASEPEPNPTPAAPMSYAEIRGYVDEQLANMKPEDVRAVFGKRDIEKLDAKQLSILYDELINY